MTDMRSAVSTVPAAGSAARAEPAPREHIGYIAYFRAVAILMIVTGHSYALAWTHGISEDPTKGVSLFNTLPALINGGTSIFVFISGFLYRQVFYGRIGYGEFMRKKALTVGLPYLIVATPLALLEIMSGTFTVTMMKEGVPYRENYFIDYIALMTTGRMVTAFWYIPCAMLLFLASPLFDRFIRMPARERFVVLAITIGIALWIHRPLDNLNPLQSLVYFTNLYLFGIIFCEYRVPIMRMITRDPVLILLLAALVFVAAVQAVVLQNVENIERGVGDGWLPLGLDLMLVQKYVMTFALCGFLARFGHLLHAPLEFLAKYSFGIFFAHGVILAVLNRLPTWLTPHMSEPLLDLLFYSAIVIAISLLMVLAVKAVTGRYSRYIIGC